MEKSIIAQAYRNNWELYDMVLNYGAQAWDYCILTASNEQQADGYRKQIKKRQEMGTLPSTTQFHTIPDPEGVRVGSGGATIGVLNWLKKREDTFAGKRVLVIHSGGDSKRLPQYSAFGKLFSRVPHELTDGRASTLFDEFFVALSGLPSRMNDGVVIVSGDVLLVFDHSQLDLCRQGVIGVGMEVPAEVGTRHGVFLTNESGNVVKVLQKASLDMLISAKACTEAGTVNIDTGLIWFDPEVAETFSALTGPDGTSLPDYLAINKLGVSFYTDLLMPLASGTKYEEYLADESEGSISDAIIDIRRNIWSKLSNIGFTAQSLRPASFIHCGSTQELRDVMTGSGSVYKHLQWNPAVTSFCNEPMNRDCCLVNAVVGDAIKTGEVCFIEDSWIEGTGELSEGVVVSNVVSSSFGYKIARDCALDQTPVFLDGETRYVTKLYGVKDNPKLHYASAGATFLNQPFMKWIEWSGLDPDCIWEGIAEKERSLWTAKLFPVCLSRDISLSATIWISGCNNYRSVIPDDWHKCRRVSMSEISGIADRSAILSAQDLIALEVDSRKFARGIQEGRNSWDVMGAIRPSMQFHSIIETIDKKVGSWTDPLSRMRGYKYLSDLIEMKSSFPLRDSHRLSNSYEDKAFAELRELLSQKAIRRKSNGGLVRDFVRVNAAARIDFGGGWSDTPPYSIENGGRVINAAIALNDALPISASVKRIDEPIIRFISVDQGVIKNVSESKELLSYDNPADPVALHKAAMVVSGLGPAYGDSFNSFVGRLGSGLEITTHVSIPKGSGLGTSSIVAGALLVALSAITGEKLSQDDLFDRVLSLEQLLTTGGGWQDQVGGLVPGIKFISSMPGVPQAPKCADVALSKRTADELNQRLMLVYTGQRRLAKRLLRTIMGNYISRDPKTVSSLSQIQVLAAMMKTALLTGKSDEFGALLGQHWQVNKVLDPGCTNPFIDELFSILNPFICGGKLAGAGGGGFIALVAKDDECVRLINDILVRTYPNSDVRIWPCRIVERALEVIE